MPSTIVPWDELVEREDVLILDTETTGSGERAEIIEIALIDTTRQGAVSIVMQTRETYPPSKLCGYTR